MQGDLKREELTDSRAIRGTIGLRWAALLCGQESIAGLSLHAAKNQILAWAAADLDIQPGALFREATAFAGTVCYDPVFARRQVVRGRPGTHQEDHARPQPGGGRLHRRHDAPGTAFPVRRSPPARMEGSGPECAPVSGLAADIPACCRLYLENSLPTPFERLEEIRRELGKLCAEPHRFLEARERERFDRCFDDFKKGYIDYYYAAHEDTVHIVGNQEKMESKVDSVALRNLELLIRPEPRRQELPQSCPRHRQMGAGTSMQSARPRNPRASSALLLQF